MPPAKKTDEIELVQPRLKELTVANFRCIGEKPVKEKRQRDHVFILNFCQE